MAIAVVAMAFLTAGPALHAQQGSALTGNIFGVVTDESGARLPGVTVTLSGVGAPQTAPTDSRGEFRFLNLAPGDRYSVTYDLQGFIKTTKTNVAVAVAHNTQADVALKLAKVEAAVTVRAEAPLLETRKVGTGANVDQAQLKEIPSARDPWVVLQTVPGVATDRVNVGGNESGQQSTFTGKGTVTAQNSWNLDGVTITDTAANGSSGTYYDFDSFEEMNFTTGGSDITAMSPGVQLNLVTKRGTNDVHGSARVMLTRKQWQSHNLPTTDDEVGLTTAAEGFKGGNRIDQVQDYGVEVGGPILKDRLWAWGAYGRNQIDLLTISNTFDKTTLEDKNAKINAQILEGTALTASYTAGDKIKIGRNAGPTRPPETTVDQSGIAGKPSELDKIEASQVVANNLFMTASYSYFRGGFQLFPEGGLAVTNVYQGQDSVWHNSYNAYITTRPQHQAGGNGSFFFNTANLGHELKFGFSYRKTPVDSQTIWPGNGNYVQINPTGNNRDRVVVTRQQDAAENLEFYNAFLGDTITMSNLTVNAGVRYDVQRGNNLAATVPASPLLPNVIPGINGAPGPVEAEWKDFSPRFGATYAAGPQKKLLLKASYARFVDQMGVGVISWDNPNALTSVTYYLKNRYVPGATVKVDDIDFTGGPFGDGIITSSNYNRTCPSCATSVNAVDPNLKSGKTDEIVAGGDYELLPELVVGLNYTYRHYKDVPDTFGTPILVGGRAATVDDFEFKRNVEGKLYDGTPFSVPLYGLKSSVKFSGGYLEANRENYTQNYHGVDLNFQKRLSHKWMVRGSFGWSDWKQSVGTNGCAGIDPTNQRTSTYGVTCASDLVAPRSTGSGSKGNVFLNARWQFNVGGLYQLPLGFNIAANFYGRQGYPFVNWVRADAGDGLGTRLVIIGNVADRRLANVYEADLRLEKMITVSPLNVALSIDVFNVANSATVLQRQGQVQSPTNPGTNGQMQEIQSPRVVRAGARISF